MAHARPRNQPCTEAWEASSTACRSMPATTPAAAVVAKREERTDSMKGEEGRAGAGAGSGAGSGGGRVGEAEGAAAEAVLAAEGNGAAASAADVLAISVGINGWWWSSRTGEEGSEGVWQGCSDRMGFVGVEMCRGGAGVQWGGGGVSGTPRDRAGRGFPVIAAAAAQGKRSVAAEEDRRGTERAANDAGPTRWLSLMSPMCCGRCCCCC